MQAYEFYTVPENGVITIPDECKKRATSGVKVILLFDKKTEAPNVRRKSDLLLPPTMSTNGWKFDREEANER